MEFSTRASPSSIRRKNCFLLLISWFYRWEVRFRRFFFPLIAHDYLRLRSLSENCWPVLFFILNIHFSLVFRLAALESLSLCSQLSNSNTIPGFFTLQNFQPALNFSMSLNSAHLVKALWHSSLARPVWIWSYYYFLGCQGSFREVRPTWLSGGTSALCDLLQTINDSCFGSSKKSPLQNHL